LFSRFLESLPNTTIAKKKKKTSHITGLQCLDLSPYTCDQDFDNRKGLHHVIGSSPLLAPIFEPQCA
jgi:hypothetical protein